MNTHFSVRSYQNQSFKILGIIDLEEDSSHLVLELHFLINSSTYVHLWSCVTTIHSLPLPLGLDPRYNHLFSYMLLQQFVTTD